MYAFGHLRILIVMTSPAYLRRGMPVFPLGPEPVIGVVTSRKTRMTIGASDIFMGRTENFGRIYLSGDSFPIDKALPAFTGVTAQAIFVL
jgi:hypothetical protein